MKTPSTKSRAKRAASSKIKPTPGVAGPGRAFDPLGSGEESGRDTARPAPAPGVPIPREDYERLKREAETTRTPPSKYRQEDPAAGHRGSSSGGGYGSKEKEDRG
jgi:hypothetical protein